jgi:hypothetical protein
MRKRVVVCFAAIAALSLAPFPVKNALRTYGILHNTGHLMIFAASGALLLADARTPSGRVWRITFLLLFCAATEALEAIIYRNRFEWNDLILDYFGAVLAPFILFGCRKLKY